MLCKNIPRPNLRLGHPLRRGIGRYCRENTCILSTGAAVATVVLLFAALLTAQTVTVVPDGEFMRLCWDRNTEADLSHYEITTADGEIFLTPDTVCAVVVHGAFIDAAAHEGGHQKVKPLALLDSIPVQVRAVDWSGNKSQVSYRVGYWPQLRLDFSADSLNRIDGEDLRRFLVLWRENMGKVVQR